VLVLFEEMIERLAGRGWTCRERRKRFSCGSRRPGIRTPAQLYLAADGPSASSSSATRELAPLERVLFAKRHPFLESHNYSEHLDGYLEPGGGIYVLHVPRDETDDWRRRKRR
jgi:hypothetical protein